MEALRYIPSSGSFSLESTEIPTIQNDDDVLIEVRFAGLCGTDIHIQQVHTDFTYILFCKIAKACAIFTHIAFIQGDFADASKIPVTLGHEFSGIVLKTGSKVTGLPKGTRVAVNPNK